MKSQPIDKASRRKFVSKLAYIAPAIVTLSVAPSFAKAASVRPTPTTRPPTMPPPRP